MVRSSFSGKISFILGDRPPRLDARLVEAGLIMYFVYVLKSKLHRKSYVGVTNDLVRRLNEHNTGKSNYTKLYAPWDVIYTEKYNTLTEAVVREKYYKSAAGRRKLKKIVFKN